MRRNPTILLALIVGLAAIAAPIAISIYLAREQSLREQTLRAVSLANDVMRRTDKTLDQAYAAQRRLEQQGGADPCSTESIHLMASLAVSSEELQGVGYVAGNQLLCSSIGWPNAAIPVGVPDYLGVQGDVIRSAVEVPLVPGIKFVLLTAASGFTAVIHPNLPVDVFEDDPSIAVGVFGPFDNRLTFHKGGFSPEWKRFLGGAGPTEVFDGRTLFATRRSSKYGYVAYAAIPAEQIEARWRQTALVMAPIGLCAGLTLALMVFYIARLQMGLPALIKTALRRNEFRVKYQPIVDLRTGDLVGAEALIEWRRPNGEIIRPDLFIPVAEQGNLVRRITGRVMEMVGRDAGGFFRRHPGFHIAINLAPADLHCQETVEALQRLAVQTGAGPHNLVVEATERGFIRPDLARRITHEIREAGVRIAIDDFGTGYSSLATLQSLELDILKIDKAFVDTIGTGAATNHVVTHIIEMARALNLELVAEGVEHEMQAQFLRESGVRYAQGWLFGKPMALPDLEAMLPAPVTDGPGAERARSGAGWAVLPTLCSDIGN